MTLCKASLDLSAQLRVEHAKKPDAVPAAERLFSTVQCWGLVM